MTERLLLVDLENVQKIDLGQVPADAHVMIFHGSTQKSFPAELVRQTQQLGSRLKWMPISGQGRNALDFHIAFYLGRHLTQWPQCECVVLSRDTGFDPLIRHLESLERTCRRVTTLKGAFPSPVSSDSADLERLVKLLREDKMRPKRRKGLEGRVKAWFPKANATARAALIEALLASGQVIEDGTALVYRFASPAP